MNERFRSERYFFIETFGCQMNEQDSLRIADQLIRLGYQWTDDYRSAHLVIVNTCSVRKKAHEKAYSFLGRVAAIKRKRRETIVACTGCVAQQEGRRLRERAPFVDLVLGPYHVAHFGDVLAQFIRTREPIVEIAHKEGAEGLECEGVSHDGAVTAYVTIMEGCDNYCSYCVVPYARGKERSRPHVSIVQEIHNLVGRGIKEVTLLGQNVNSYRSSDVPQWGFPHLLKEVCGIEGLERVRFTTSHPKDLSQELIDCFGALDVLCEHIHLPLQSGSDRVLYAMNRRYTIEHYMRKVESLRMACPEIAITTDIIVGFPGESEKDFEETLEALETIQFDGAFSFAYSARPGTHAALLEDKLSDNEKRERLRLVQERQSRITLRKHTKLVGTHVEILVEGVSKDGHRMMGRTRTNKIVNVEGSRDLVGSLRTVEIVRGCKNSLVGRLDPVCEGMSLEQSVVQSSEDYTTQE